MSYRDRLIQILTIKGVLIKPDTLKYTESELKKSSKIILNTTAFNFGKVKKGQVITTIIPIRNGGKDTLKILSYQMACQCIQVEILKQKRDKTITEINSVPPGKKAVLKIRYTVSNDLGLNTNIVTLFLNDKKNPRTVISLTAEIINKE